MAVKQKLGLRVNYLIIFLSGAVLLISGILVFLLIVKNIYGNYQVNEILPTKKNLESFENKSTAGLLYSQYTENMLETGSTWLSDIVDTWEVYLKSAKMNYKIISDQTIELGKQYKYQLLILPSAKSLSDKEIVEIKKYIENGGSLFVTGGPATYSKDGKWRGWNFFTSTFGMKFNKEIKPEEFYKVHTLRGGLPITAGIPAGYALKIATWDRPIYAKILEPRTTQASFWYDFRREAGLVREEIKNSAGIAYGTYGKGRFVWFGFDLASVVGKQQDYIFFARLFSNCINWLTYRPTGLVRTWPAPYDAAAIFLPAITKDPGNINNILGMIKNKRFPATFFVNSYTAETHPQLIRNVAKYGNLGIIADIGFLESTRDTINKLDNKLLQETTIHSAKDTVEKISGVQVNSFMPRYGFFDENTWQALSKENMQFLVTDSLTDRAVPKLVIRNNKRMLLITNTVRDDYEVVKRYGLKNTEFQDYTYEEDVDRILFEGGLYVFKMHTDAQLKPQYSSVVSDVLNYIGTKNIWITSLNELRNWWLRKGSIEVQYNVRSKRRIAVEITNPTNNTVTNFIVQVNLNKNVRNIKISSNILYEKIPKYTFDPSTDIIYLNIQKLGPNESLSLLIDFENVNS